MFWNVEKLILQSYNIKSNMNFYNETEGTAAGARFAPICANLLMKYFEIKIYNI